MKYIILLLVSFTALTACGQTAPESKPVDTRFPAKPIGWTSDFAKIFTADQVADLDKRIADHEKQTTNQVAVVSLELDSTAVRSPEDFDKLTLDLFNAWGIGAREKKNGIAIIIAPGLRTVRIQTGDGLEEKLTDVEAKAIIDDVMLPEFKKGNFYRGVVMSLQRLFQEIH